MGTHLAAVEMLSSTVLPCWSRESLPWSLEEADSLRE